MLTDLRLPVRAVVSVGSSGYVDGSTNFHTQIRLLCSSAAGTPPYESLVQLMWTFCDSSAVFFFFRKRCDRTHPRIGFMSGLGGYTVR